MSQGTLVLQAELSFLILQWGGGHFCPGKGKTREKGLKLGQKGRRDAPPGTLTAVPHAPRSPSAAVAAAAAANLAQAEQTWCCLQLSALLGGNYLLCLWCKPALVSFQVFRTIAAPV